MSTPVQTYKQVVETFRGIANSHMSVKQFGIGRPSDFDIETDVFPFQRYPVVFLIPNVSTMGKFGRTVLGFSLIVADIAEDNNEELTINTQNNTFMIVQDILSKIFMTTWDEVDIALQDPVTIIPFQENANNNLTGWRCELNVITKSPFDLCSAAFEA
jgi:hypothetical protein